mmetsp:Transcript_26578/g.63138  ORF Transcript_26578/g.63138 Transcript_26578/m.63138 type:complete len:233 (-) Transcript_26578:94-792(-)
MRRASGPSPAACAFSGTRGAAACCEPRVFHIVLSHSSIAAALWISCASDLLLSTSSKTVLFQARAVADVAAVSRASVALEESSRVWLLASALQEVPLPLDAVVPSEPSLDRTESQSLALPNLLLILGNSWLHTVGLACASQQESQPHYLRPPRPRCTLPMQLSLLVSSRAWLQEPKLCDSKRHAQFAMRYCSVVQRWSDSRSSAFGTCIGLVCQELVQVAAQKSRAPASPST